jgi:hypothetical protein
MSGRIAYLGDTVQDNLLLYLDAAKKESYTTGSSIWYDISNNSNDGTINNSPVFSKENGGLLVFDGINDNILTSYNGIPPLLSIEYVVSFNNDIGTYVVVGKYGIEGDYWTGLLSNKITFSMNGSSMDTGENITINTFYHVVCVFNSSTRDLYVNGVLKNSQPLFFLSIIDTTKLHTEEYNFFKDLVVKGVLYEYFVENLYTKDRNAAKLMIYKVLFGKNGEDSSNKIFKNRHNKHHRATI